MKSSSAKQKGKRLEYQIASRINSVLGSKGITAKRMVLSGAAEGLEGDIMTNLPVDFELKNQETWKIHEWWEQAESQCRAGKFPVLVMSRNHMKEPLAVIKFEDLLTLFDYALEAGWVSSFKKGRRIIK